MNYLIKNGTVLDTTAGIHDRRDLFVLNTRMTDITPENIQITIDATDCFVSPGFIDFHTHVFPTGNAEAIYADQMLSVGTTTCVDAGSAGITNFESFYRNEICHSQMRILAQLCVCPIGQPGHGVEETHNPIKLEQSLEQFINLCEKYPHIIRGAKIKYDTRIVKEYGIDALLAAKKLSNAASLPLVVHTTFMPSPVETTLQLLSPGDVYCHMYHGQNNTILNKEGHVSAACYEAKTRGILFDCSNGITNFNLKVAQRAISECFQPDIISSDATKNTFGRVGSAQSLAHVMSKYLELGITLPEIIRAVTTIPARKLGMEDFIGTLQPEASADIVIYRLESINVPFIDCANQVCIGHQLLVPKLVICQGNIVYRASDFFG